MESSVYNGIYRSGTQRKVRYTGIQKQVQTGYNLYVDEQEREGYKMLDLMHARQAFRKYLEQFDREAEKIKLKIVHTEGVIRCAQDICKRMALSEEDCRLAELIALLHDIGRFEQVRLYDSFEPAVMDHAAFGVQLLFGERQMIRQFAAEDKWDHIIRQAIARHSDFSVGEGLTPQELLHACIIRDADKLDNCRVKLDEKIEVLLGCSKEEAGSQAVSPEVWKECLKRSSIHSANRKTKMDYWVSYIAYFFDINYPETCEIILENGYVDKIIERIPYSNRDTEQKMRELYDSVITYLKDRTSL